MKGRAEKGRHGQNGDVVAAAISSREQNAKANKFPSDTKRPNGSDLDSFDARVRLAS